jgi:hypothetical protein
LWPFFLAFFKYNNLNSELFELADYELTLFYPINISALTIFKLIFAVSREIVSFAHHFSATGKSPDGGIGRPVCRQAGALIKKN